MYMGLFKIFNIFNKTKEKSDVNPLEQERLNKISNSKSVLYSSVFDNVTSSIKRDYVNSSKTSYIYVGIPTLDVMNLDNDTNHKVALKATYDSASQLGIKIRANLEIDYPYIRIRVYYD